MRSEATNPASIRDALVALGKADDLRESARRLFHSLGYASGKTLSLDGSPEGFLSTVPGGEALLEKPSTHVSRWKRVEFLFQLTNDEIPALGMGQSDLFLSPADYRSSIPESFVFLAMELEAGDWSRTQLVAITREINRLFPMPVLILFRYGPMAALTVIDRRPSRKDTSRDVVSKRISIIKDIDLREPHRAHVDILCDIALANVKVRGSGAPSNFRDLYEGWLQALSAQALNTRFYRELASWFFWSTKLVEFPAAVRARDNPSSEGEQKQAFESENQIAVIRLLTRLIFVWFIKEKGLVPAALFEPSELKGILKEDPTDQGDSSTYYKAVLQNLFFATLNSEMSSARTWRTKSTPGGGIDGHYLVHAAYRFRDAFADPDRALALFREVPFLNGGLFECLDREVSEKELERNPVLERRIVREGSRKVLRIDGFSERPDNPLKVPNRIFFAKGEKVDLNAEFDTKGKVYEADGLIELFSRYKFTVEENTPVEEEVALDPELLGKVFENLLASYNADTRTTARKKSGSFYTPREVVDYMVDEALVAYFETKLGEPSGPSPLSRARQQGLDMTMPGELDLVRTPQSPAPGLGASSDLGARLRKLLSFQDTEIPFSPAEADRIILAIDNLRALDPACGSGAFPMGLLQKLIHVLHKLDPDNERWRAQNRRPLEARLEAARQTVDPSAREGAIEDAEAALAKLDHDFSDANRPDYARKLYLIDKCLFGVDIQPIAVQIAKLRFFISLVVSQKIDRTQDNANITALPNLETKLVAADSLIPIEREAQEDLFRNPRIAAKELELRAMNARYFGARTARTKRLRREDIARLRDELADLLKSDRGLQEDDANRMAEWDPFDQNTAAKFFDPEWMFGLSSRFDLVIGNPPYVRQEAIKDQKPALQRFYSGSKDSPGAYAGTADLLVYFIQRGIELLNPGGAFAYITSNKWYRAKYGQNLRAWMNRHADIKRIVDFGDAEVFDAIGYPTILVATRRQTPASAPGDHDSLRVLNWPQDLTREDIPGFPRLVDEIGFDMPQKALSIDGWQLAPQARRGLLERIRAAGMPLGQYVEGRFYYGIKTGFNDAFVIDGPTRDRLIAEHASSAEIIKPFLRGRDIKRWRVEPQDLWLIRIESSENKTHPWTGLPDAEAETVFAKALPSIHAFMITHRKELRKRHDQGKYFWELRSCAYWRAFHETKIIYPDIYEHQSFSWDTSGSYGSNTCYFIPTEQRWLTGFLNSNLVEWFYGQISNQIRGGYLRAFSEYIQRIPIPNRSTETERLHIDTIVSIQIERRDNRLEQLLNGFVYELFFKDDLHARGLNLFDEAERAGLDQLAGLEGSGLMQAAEAFAATHLVPGGRLRTMLSDLATLDVVRIIEDRE